MQLASLRAAASPHSVTCFLPHVSSILTHAVTRQSAVRL